jgi:hypothetical protein
MQWRLRLTALSLILARPAAAQSLTQAETARWEASLRNQPRLRDPDRFCALAAVAHWMGRSMLFLAMGAG